jgi:N-acetyl-gamma-glutamyl-phosphate reductase
MPKMTLIPAEDAAFGDVDVVFSCLPHGDSIKWVERVRAAGACAIDLSADLRVVDEKTPAWAQDVVYGMPELHRDRIRGAKLVANPGCYPTAATLGIAPLVRRGLIGGGPVIINAASGVTGAGRSPKRELLFAEVGEDYRAYAVGNIHRHLGEMRDQVAKLSPNGAPELVFTPHLLPVRVGILETIYIPLKAPLSVEDGIAMYRADYSGEPFVQVLTDRTPQLTDVVGTNLVAISVVGLQGVSSPMLMVVVAEDNLIKGASGQALQNLNVMMGWPEALGLE